jgi:hypothetical protein
MTERVRYLFVAHWQPSQNCCSAQELDNCGHPTHGEGVHRRVSLYLPPIQQKQKRLTTMGDNNHPNLNEVIGQVRWSSRLSGRKRRLGQTDDDDDSKNGTMLTLSSSIGRDCYRPKTTWAAWKQDCGVLPSE